MEFSLLPWREAFIADVAKNANNKAIAANLRDVFPFPYTEDDARGYVEGCMLNDENQQLCRAIVINNEAIGSIGVFVKDDVYRKSAELGYWLAQPYWGQGVMTQAVKLLCQEAFERFDIVRIFAEPYASNCGSRRVLEKAGFQQEGLFKNSVFKNGRLLDSCMYALLKQEDPINA